MKKLSTIRTAQAAGRYRGGVLEAWLDLNSRSESSECFGACSLERGPKLQNGEKSGRSIQLTVQTGRARRGIR